MSSVSSLVPKLFFLDVEVDSVPKEEGDPVPCITQIAVYCPEREAIKNVFEAYVKPPKELRKKKEEMHFEHGYVEPPKHTFKKIWPHLREWVNSDLKPDQRALFVMHNSNHDWSILQAELSRFGEGVPRYWRSFCSFFLSNALQIPGDHSLTGLCHNFNVPVLQAHNAYNDVVMLKELFSKMINGADMQKVLKAALDPEHPVRAVVEVIKTNVTALWVFFDFETTGLFPKKGQGGQNPRAVELAGFIPETNESFSTLINPGYPIPGEASKIHSIFDKDVKDAPDFKQAWTTFENWIDQAAKKTAKKIVCLAGHNIWGYDLPLYESECERVGLQKKRWKSFDTLYFSRSLHKGLKISHKLQDLRASFKIPEDQAHRAGGDVRVNHLVFQKLIEGVPEQKINAALMSAHPILSMAQTVKDFGKYNPKHYFEAPTEKPVVSVLSKRQGEEVQPQQVREFKRIRTFIKVEANQTPSSQKEEIEEVWDEEVIVKT